MDIENDWQKKPVVLLSLFLEGKERTGVTVYGTLVHTMPNGDKVVEVESGKWDGYLLIVPRSFWERISITEE